MAVTWREVERRLHTYLLTSSRAEATAQTYTRNVGLFWRWALAREIDPITAPAEALRLYLSHLLEHLSHNTVPLRMACLRAFYAFVKDAGWRSDDPTDKIDFKRHSIAPRPPLLKDELTAVLDGCRNPRDRAMIVVAVSCGMRIKELVGIRREDVDLRRDQVLLRGKGGKERWVALCPPAKAAILPFLLGRIGPIWLMKDGRPMTIRRAQRNIWEIARRAGVPTHWHQMRTTFATAFLDQTHDVESLRELLGHSDVNTTLRYTRYTSQRRALEQMRRFESPVGLPDAGS